MLGGHYTMRVTCFLICTSLYWRTIHSQPKAHIGPTECVEMTPKKYRARFLTEFPTEPEYDIENGLNFLEIGDTCNANAEINFRAEMKMKYEELRFDDSKSIRDQQLDNVFNQLNVIWNKWRTSAADGEAGTRICNPRRLLGCHGTLKICVCLQDFTVGVPGDKEYRADHAVILARPALEMTIVHNEVINRTVCKAVEGSFCDWEVPWLFFCQIPCLGGEDCVGQLGARGRKICRPCKTEGQCATNENFYPKFLEGSQEGTSTGANATRPFFHRIEILFAIVCFTKIW